MSSFRWREELRQTVRLAVPLALAMLGNMAMGIVDTMVVGRYSATELAGVAAGNAIFWSAVVVGYGIMVGMETVIAQAHGARDDELCLKGLTQGMWLGLAIGLVMTPLVLLVTRFYHLTGARAEVVAAAKPYLYTLAGSYPLLMIYNAFQRYWQAREIAAPMTVIIVVANVFNYVFNLAFVEGRWGFAARGAQGAALATLGCRVFMVVSLLLVTWFLWQREGKQAWRSFRNVDWPLLKQMTRLGLPAGGQVAMEMGAFAGVTTLVAGIGALELAAHHTVLTIASACFMIPLGMSSAAAIRVGTHVGAGAPEHARRSGWLSLKLGAATMGLFALVLFTGRDALLAFFTNDPQVVTLGMSILLLCVLFQVFDGIQVIGAGTLRGIGDTRHTLVANFIGHYVAGLPIGLFMCYVMGKGLVGLWMGLAAGLMATAILITWFWYRGSQSIRRFATK